MSLTKEKLTPESSVMDSIPNVSRKRFSWSLTPRFWQRFFQGILIVVFAALTAGLGSLYQLTKNSFLTTADQFSWMVLVQGDSLQNDEIGSRLRQLPGARDVKYVSPAMAFNQLQQDPLYMVDTSAFAAEDLPASWRVHWDARSVDFSLLKIFADDVRHLDGVMEVAYDPRQLDLIHRLRIFNFAVQTSFWCAGMFAVFGIVFLLGRLIFFKPPRSWSWKSFGVALVRDELWWILGCAPVWIFLSHVLPWPIMLAGFLVGAIHTFWDALDSR